MLDSQTLRQSVKVQKLEITPLIMSFRVPSVFLFLSAAFLLAANVQAQTELDPARAAAATATGTIAQSAGEAANDLEDENPFAKRSPGDSDLGQQLLLKPRVNAKPFKFSVDASYYWTDNAANQAQNKAQDYFLATGVNLGWQQRLKGRFYGDAYLGQQWFRYDSMRELDYENAEASIGLLAILPELKNSIFHLHYHYQRITREFGSPIYEAHNIRVGLQKTFLIDRMNSISTGWVSSFVVSASPERLQRHEHAFQLGHHLKFSSRWMLSTQYRLAYFDYFNFNGRADWYQIMGTSLTYKACKNFEVSAGYYFSINQSNNDFFDYQSQLGGLSLTAKVQF